MSVKKICGPKLRIQKRKAAREGSMQNYLRFSRTAAAVLAFAAFAPSAIAQEVFKFSCQVVGGSGTPEPLGDREGHNITVLTASCRSAGGVLDGALTTAQEIWEWDGPNAKMLLESGVIRKPGALATFELTEGNLALTMTDGKVTGFTASGKGRWPTASGTAASLAGKSGTFKSWPTGAGQWEAEWTVEQ
jgi:hypothetical protein